MVKFVKTTSRRQGRAVKFTSWPRILVGLCVLVTCHTFANRAYAQDGWAALPDPTRPWTASVKEKVKSDPPPLRLTLESTLVSGERRLAVINGINLSVGDAINGYLIKLITPYRVELVKNRQVMTLRLVEDDIVQTRASQGAFP